MKFVLYLTLVIVSLFVITYSLYPQQLACDKKTGGRCFRFCNFIGTCFKLPVRFILKVRGCFWSKPTNLNSPLEIRSSWFERVRAGYKLVASVFTFFPSFWYQKVRFGNAFNFNTVIRPAGTVPYTIKQNDAGDILQINEGNKTVAVGTIICNEKELQKIKDTYSIQSDTNIALYTFNRDFESRWAGLTRLEKKHPNITVSKYPTTDYRAPSLIDLIRFINDLMHQKSSITLAYLHCLAGSGRSIVAVAAYLLCFFHQNHITVTPQQVEAFLHACRAQVDLNSEHRARLVEFQAALQKAGSFQALYNTYKQRLEK